ncbi:hypothetical protein NX059_005257 [Plenodomus lindquistii]|nr:hypothetical protein NX059_005257 [Plenodomus lindquistii]
MHMTTLCKPLWVGPTLLNKSVFSPQRIHPFGFGAPWSEQDADLMAAVVVSLGASSKTGRGFAWEMARNRDVRGDGPLAMLQVSSKPAMLGRYETELPMMAVAYEDVKSATQWVGQFMPKRVVVVDFGAPDSVVESVVKCISDVCARVTVIAVGYEAKIYTPEELEGRLAQTKMMEKVQLNTSGLRDRAIDAEGAKEYFYKVGETWSRCLGEKVFDDLQIRVCKAVGGQDGIEGAWGDLCGRRVPVSVGIVVDLSKV